MEHLHNFERLIPAFVQRIEVQCAFFRRRSRVWLRAALVEAAWAASHIMQTYLSAKYRRLAGRLGKKRAIVAVGHTVLVMMYDMLGDGVVSQELGSDYLDKLQPLRLTTYLVKRLESLGHKVTLAQADQAA